MPNVWDAMKKHQAEEMAKAKELEAKAKEQAASTAKTKSTKTSGQGLRVSAAAKNAPVAKAPAGAVPAGLPAMSRNGRRYSAVLVPHHDRGGAIAEQYRALRTNLLARAVNEKFCTLVTSAEPDEGKTVTCLNLAMVLAERQEFRTIVIDCDLRKGRIADLLAEKRSPGMVDLLQEKASLKDVIRQTVYPNVFYIPAGVIAAEQVGELIARPRLEDMLSEVQRQFDYIMLDSPPVNTVADAGIFGRPACVEEALLVVRMNKTSRDSVDRAIRLLHAADVKISGMVLTHQEFFIPNYLYRYS